VDQILMPFIQPMHLPAGIGRPDPARCPALAQVAIGDRSVTTELDMARP
jgi:hypothetical protein